MKKPMFAIFLSALFLSLPSSRALAEAYGSGWYGEVQFAIEHEDDVSRSYKSEDQVSDEISSVSLGGGHSRKIDTSGQWVIAGYLNYRDHKQYDDLDSLALSGGVSWIHQPVASYTAHWYGVGANVSYQKFRDSDAREGVFFDLDANINRRLTTRWVGHLGYRYADIVFLNKDENERSRDAAFDTATHEIYVGVDFQWTNRMVVFAEYGFRHGGITSTVSGGVDPSIDYEAETLDPVFDNCGGDPRCGIRFAYRVVSDMHKLNLGVSLPFRSVTLDLSSSYLEAKGEGQSYQDWMVKLGVIWNF